MSRDPYRASTGELGLGGRGGQRWDTERFERERFEERDTRVARGGGGFRERDVSVDEVFDRRGGGGRGFEEDRFREKVYYEPEEPRFAREPPRRPRGQSITIEREKEKEYYSPSPPRRAPARPGFLRRQSSLDTFDRIPLARYSEREEYGPPARRPEYRPEPLPPMPMPRYRALPPPRRYAERDFEEIKITEPDFGDDDYRVYPERVREREIIRTRRRSRSSSSSSSSSSSGTETVKSSKTSKSEFPKRGKTRMPAKLVSKKAIIDLGYPFEEEVSYRSRSCF